MKGCALRSQHLGLLSKLMVRHASINDLISSVLLVNALVSTKRLKRILAGSAAFLVAGVCLPLLAGERIHSRGDTPFANWRDTYNSLSKVW
jgi:hypothetical protein